MVQFLTTLQQYINEETLALLFKVHMEYITDVNFKNHLTNKVGTWNMCETRYKFTDDWCLLTSTMKLLDQTLKTTVVLICVTNKVTK